MRLSLRLILSLLLLLPAARAQWLTADDFFNDGAHAYLSNNIPQALQSVQTGLKQYPDDDHLKKLYELLKQQQQQQQQQQNQQQQPKQNQQQQQKQEQQNQSQQNQQPKPDPQAKPNQAKQAQQNQARQNQNGQKAGETNEQAQAAQMTQMTPEEAKRLLDQQKNDEQVLVMKPRGKPQDALHTVKDW